MRPCLLAAIAALLLLAPAAAFANGDPASDILLQSKVYFPAAQPVSAAEANKLKTIVQEANAKGYAIRVALIKDASDLGTVPNLLNQPQKYADFLGPEIRFVYKGDLLVVMPTGLGLTTTDGTAPPTKAIQGMQVEAGGSSDGLAQTAEEAVGNLAAAAGHPLNSTKKGGSGGVIAGIVVAVVLLGLGIVGAFWLRRSQSAQRQQSAPPAEPADAEQTAP